MTLALEMAGSFFSGFLVALVALAVAVKYLGPRLLRKKLQGAMLDFTPPKK